MSKQNKKSMDENDVQDNLPLYVERLEFAFNGFIRGQKYEEGEFELRNPLLNKEV